MSMLSERAMLANLSMGIWSGRNVDRDVTEEVSTTYHSDPTQSGSYTKQLVARKFLHPVNVAARLARQTHRLLTLPWSDEGERILSNTGYIHYHTQMRMRRLTFDAAASAFCKGLPDYITEAQTRLKDMFDEADYPTTKELRHKFSFDVEIKPVPNAGDFRVKMSDDTVKAIVADIEQRSEERVKQAMNDLYGRVIKVASHMSERLRAYKPATDKGAAEGRFRDTLVSDVVELADLMSSLNITQDPRVEELKKELKEGLAQHSPEILRVDAKARRDTAALAEAMAKKAKVYMV